MEYGVGPEGNGAVVIRSGALGAYVATRKGGGEWIPAFWNVPEHVVDVTGGFLTHHFMSVSPDARRRCR